MPTLLGSVQVAVGANISGLMSGLGMASRALKAFTDTPVTAVGLGLAGVAAAAIGVAGVTTKMAADFRSGMTTLVTGAGESAKNLQMVSDGVLGISQQTGASTKDLTAGMYEIESAGQHGAQGLATLTAAAEGARVGNASLMEVANGVTTEMTDYAASGLTATQATNDLIATVSAGKVQLGALSTAMSTILPTSAALHVSLTDTSAAMATMTGEGTNAAAAATYLRQLLMALEAPAKKGATSLAEIGLSTRQVSNEMKVSLPGTLQMITDALAKKFPVGSAAYVDALKNIAGGSKQMQGILELTGTHLKVFQGNVESISTAVKQGGDSIQGWATVQKDFNQRLDEAWAAVNVLGIRIGSGLLPIMGQLLGAVTPLIGAFSDWLTSTHGLVGGITNMTGAIDGAFSTMAQKATQSSLQMKLSTTQNLLGMAQENVSAIRQQQMQIAQELSKTQDATVRTTLQMRLNVLNEQSKTAQGTQTNYQNLVKNITDQLNKLTGTTQSNALQQKDIQISNTMAMTQRTIAGYEQMKQGIIQQLNNTTDTVKRHALIQQLDQINAAEKAKKGVLLQLEQQRQGVEKQMKQMQDAQQAQQNNPLLKTLQSLTPLMDQLGKSAQKAGGIIGGQFSQSWADLQKNLKPIMPEMQQLGDFLGHALGVGIQLTGGIIAMFIRETQGMVEFIGGILATLVDLVTLNFGHLKDDGALLLKGMYDMFIQPFIDLYNNLVGHSIIPDTVNGIISWLAQLPGRGLSAIQSLQTKMTDFFGGLATKAVSWGTNLISGLITGIQNMMGNIGSTMNNVVSYIGSFLPHSPARQGELSHLNEYGPNFVKGFAQGIERATPTLQAALNVMMQPVASSVAPQSYPSQAAYAPAGQQPVIHVHNHNHIYIDGREMADVVGQRMLKIMQRSGGVGKAA